MQFGSDSFLDVLANMVGILIILIVAAMITPGPDVVSQLLLATPTYLLFEISIWVAQWLEPKDAP